MRKQKLQHRFDNLAEDYIALCPVSMRETIFEISTGFRTERAKHPDLCLLRHDPTAS